MGNIFMPSLQVTKMAFTDLIPAILGTSGVSTQVTTNVTDFFKNATPSAKLLTQYQAFQQSFQNLNFILGQVRNPVVQLYMNPSSIKINKKVLLDKKQTRGGFVVQFWGHDLEEIQVTAATAYFELSKEPLAAFELLKRQVYQGRFSDTQPFRGSPIISMLFESQVLNGYFNDFNWTVTAKQPFQFEYDFRFTVTQNLSFSVGNNLTNAVSDVVNAVRKGSFNINTNRSDVSVLPEEVQFGKGWGVQLY